VSCPTVESLRARDRRPASLTYRGFNAPMESFWGSMQVEQLDRQRWRTHLELAVSVLI
jgi:hypothetical protein